ncbi:MAG: cache domain-containing protein [Desulfuromonadaceae bacterium]|nr:cache domain-containing protein [Desulfuromonadaceae bacterium]
MRTFSFSNIPIRIQLIVLAILLTLPALGIIVYSGIKVRNDNYRMAVIESQKLADHLAAEQENLVHEARQLSGFIAELPDVANRNNDRLQFIISNILKKNPQYLNILITDESGRVLASGLPYADGISLAGRRYFKNARSTQRFSSGEYSVGLISNKPTIAMAYPLVDHNIFRGVVMISFDLDVLKSILKRSQLPPNSNYILVDHNGTIISRGSENGRNVGDLMMPLDLEKMVKGPDRDTYEFVRSDGDRRVTTYRKLRLPGEQTPYMYVRAGISIKEAVARADLHLWNSVAMMVPFVLLALILALFIGKSSIVDRVKKLQTASRCIGGGNLKTRVGDQVAGGELGELGRAFDEMASTLEKNINELNRSQQLLHEKKVRLEGEIAERQVVQEDLAEKQRMLESLNRTLEERIEAAVKELRQKDQAMIQQSRLASMGEMINNIAHQWRQPLNVIGLIAQGLPARKDLSQSELDHEVGLIMNVVTQMSQTIDDFRNFFRIDKEKIRFSANQAVAKAVEFISPSLINNGISTVIDEQPDVAIIGYNNEYAQVLLNILTNAKDVLMERNVAVPRITVSITRADDRSVVTITDNGGGIGKDIMPKIFDPYFTTKEKTHGTGIGLYMSKIIIEQNMGGSLTARNVEGGVAFRIVV